MKIAKLQRRSSFGWCFDIWLISELKKWERKGNWSFVNAVFLSRSARSTSVYSAEKHSWFFARCVWISFLAKLWENWKDVFCQEGTKDSLLLLPLNSNYNGVLYLKRGLGSKFLWEFQMGWNVLQIFVRSFSLKSFTCFVNLCLYRPEILGVVAKRQEDASFSYRQNFCCLKFCGSTRSGKKKPKFQHPYNLLPDSRCVIAVLKCKSGFDSLSFLGERSFVNNGSESSKNALFWAEQKEKKYTTSTKSVFRFLSALR